MQYRIRFFSFFILLISIISISIMSCSFGPPVPQPWFNEALELADHDFPPGVDFVVVREGSNECYYYDSIVVTNTSSTPIFIPAISSWVRPTALEELDEPCPDNNLCMKVISNQAWEWNIINIEESPPRDYDWVLVHRYGESEYLEIFLYGKAVMSSNYVILDIELLNKFDYGDGRPDSVVPPQPQEFDLPYIYGDEERSVGITVLYTINECYSKDRTIAPFEIIAICFGSILALLQDSDEDVRNTAGVGLTLLGHDSVAEKEIMMIRGGFGEPYCSQECHDKGGDYASAVMLKNQTGVCGICQKPVQASMYGTSNCAIVPYENVNLFICNSCTTQGKAFLRNYRKCCMCQKSL